MRQGIMDIACDLLALRSPCPVGHEISFARECSRSLLQRLEHLTPGAKGDAPADDEEDGEAQREDSSPEVRVPEGGADDDLDRSAAQG